MRKGKSEFVGMGDNSEETASDFSFEPTASAYRIYPTSERRQLTVEDEAYNQRVEQLFHHVQPGLPIDADPTEIRREPHAFSELIEKAIKKLKLNVNPVLDELAGSWPSLLPPALAQVTRPERWNDGVLYVGVTSSTQLFEVRRLHLRTIEAAVRKAVGERVRHVRLIVASVPRMGK
jgi:predicted nucleic acid-binding Zn ribbon protein